MRLVSVGNVIVDILTRVPELPERGGDVLATGGGMSAGGSFNALVAAVRQGLPSAYAGGHGTGFFGDLVRSQLAGAGIDVLLAPNPGLDSGYDVAMVDDGGERTFVTSFGAEASLSADALGAVLVGSDDLVHLSGYGLLETTNARVLAPWLASLDPAVLVLFDPGPLVADIRSTVFESARARADWLSCNAREAMLLAGTTDAATAAARLAASSKGVLIRLGPDGCLLGTGGDVEYVPGFAVDALDTNGAGDAHSGAFLAALAAGLAPSDAAIRANACAAIAVSRSGPATAPTLAQTLEFVARASA